MKGIKNGQIYYITKDIETSLEGNEYYSGEKWKIISSNKDNVLVEHLIDIDMTYYAKGEEEHVPCNDIKELLDKNIMVLNKKYILKQILDKTKNGNATKTRARKVSQRNK